MSENDEVNNYNIKELTNNASSSSVFYMQAKAQMNKQIEELEKMYDKTLQMRFATCSARMNLLLLKKNKENIEQTLKKYQDMQVTSLSLNDKDLYEQTTNTFLCL